MSRLYRIVLHDIVVVVVLLFVCDWLSVFVCLFVCFLSEFFVVWA